MIRILAFLCSFWTFAAFAASPVPPDGIISTSGDYYLTGNRSSNGTNFALLISASNVTLDLRGFIVQCSPPSPSTQSTFGIIAHYQSNVLIRDGKTAGCVQGISVLFTSNVTIENVEIHARFRGIFGNDAVTGLKVRNSIIADISGFPSQAYAIGVDRPGANCTIEGNAFRNLHRQPGVPLSTPGEGVAVIFSPNSTGCWAGRNWIENDTAGTHLDIGFWVGNAAIGASDNTFVNIGRAIASSPGFDLLALGNHFWMRQAQTGSYAIGAQNGLAKDNLIIGYDTPIQGNIPVGTGNFSYP